VDVFVLGTGGEGQLVADRLLVAHANARQAREKGRDTPFE
jgi:hypothetical protein